jgi:uncharacterized protein (TIGR00730 family)
VTTAGEPAAADVAALATRVLDELAAGGDRRLAQQLLESALGLVADRPDALDLKIAAAAMSEMREAFAVFAPFRDVPKVTVFGSARTRTDDPLYTQANLIAAQLAARGWMVVTGAGPGIMQAAMEGAGREHSIGVSIRLPFEQGANPVIAGDDKAVSMKYFFTRKLMLVKESRAFVCLPGGFGTLDETFELLTLTQTGKGVPVPIVFLDTAGDTFWNEVDDFVRKQIVSRNLVNSIDRGLYFVTDSSDEACREIERFYANYDSIRYIGSTAVVRLRHEPTDSQIAELNARFGPDSELQVADGPIERSRPLPVEVRQADKVELPRLRFDFTGHRYGTLRALIDAVNTFV